MGDQYRSWNHLRAFHQPGQDFRLIAGAGTTRTLILGLHGGEIEPGTSELVRYIAGRDHQFYLFEGLQHQHEKLLHLTSTRFDEPLCVDMVRDSERVVSIHGCKDRTSTVYIGGLDLGLRALAAAQLVASGFDVDNHSNRRLHGVHVKNICNRNRRGMGLQIEVSGGLRVRMFRRLHVAGRRDRTPTFHRFVLALRTALRRAAALDGSSVDPVSALSTSV